jgi:hypothetical protein
MRLAFLNIFFRSTSPFEGLKRHADLIRQAAPVFQKAILAHIDDKTEEFESCHNEILVLEDEGDRIKRNIRGHLPWGILLPADKFQILWYLREQDKVLDGTEDSLNWLSYRRTPVPEEMMDDILLLAKKVSDVLNSVYPLVEAADLYFKTVSANHRSAVKNAIRTIREYEMETDRVERKLLSDILSYPFTNPTAAYHLSELVQHMGGISDHAENAGDMMRAMIAR